MFKPGSDRLYDDTDIGRFSEIYRRQNDNIDAGGGIPHNIGLVDAACCGNQDVQVDCPYCSDDICEFGRCDFIELHNICPAMGNQQRLLTGVGFNDDFCLM